MRCKLLVPALVLALLLALSLIMLPFSACAVEYIVVSGKISEEAKDISRALNNSESEMSEMSGAGFSIIRYNDTLVLAKNAYDAQVALEKTGKEADYYLVSQKIEELKKIKNTAYKASDELKALESAISQAEGIDKEPVLELYSQAYEAFESERYEESIAVIDKTYKKIDELEAFETKLRAFYEATSRGIINFVRQNWLAIAAVLAALAVIGIFSYDRIIIYLIRKRIENMENRKKSIRGLMAKSQQGYFEAGKLSETTYQTRTAKYAELVRDINRQIPMLREELEMHLKKRRLNHFYNNHLKRNGLESKQPVGRSSESKQSGGKSNERNKSGKEKAFSKR